MKILKLRIFVSYSNFSNLGSILIILISFSKIAFSLEISSKFR